MGSKQNQQLLSALADTFQRSRQNRTDTVSALSTLRSHLTIVTSCHEHVANALQSPQKQLLHSSSGNSQVHTELLLEKYREKCKRLQEELYDTKARVSTSESHIQDLEVNLVFYCFPTFSYTLVSHSFQEVIRKLQMRLDSAYQELYGQPDIPSVASKTNQPVEIEVDSKSGAVGRVSESRPQQLSRVMLQPCLSLTMSTAQQNVRGAHASCIV
jgi:hypothetical protein